MRDFKKFTARQIYRQFQAENDVERLAFLRRAREKSNQVYKVWEKGFDARDVFSIKFLEQKIDYIHQIPCQPRWNLSEVPEDHIWSTASYYLKDKQSVIPVDDIREYLHN